MKKPKISIISAIGRKTRIIGKEGGNLPWKISEDFKHFKETTMNHPMIMGRKTWEEFGGNPLPGRLHIVITRQENYSVPENVFVVKNIEEAIKRSGELDTEEIFIIGGGQIYREGMRFSDRLYLTLVDTDMTGPVTFPEYEDFNKVISARESSDENFKYEFVVLEKE